MVQFGFPCTFLVVCLCLPQARRLAQAHTSTSRLRRAAEIARPSQLFFFIRLGSGGHFEPNDARPLGPKLFLAAMSFSPSHSPSDTLPVMHYGTCCTTALSLQAGVTAVFMRARLVGFELEGFEVGCSRSHSLSLR